LWCIIRCCAPIYSPDGILTPICSIDGNARHRQTKWLISELTQTCLELTLRLSLARQQAAAGTSYAAHLFASFDENLRAEQHWLTGCRPLNFFSPIPRPRFRAAWPNYADMALSQGVVRCCTGPVASCVQVGCRAPLGDHAGVERQRRPSAIPLTGPLLSRVHSVARFHQRSAPGPVLQPGTWRNPDIA
jgi:hypothetical protein